MEETATGLPADIYGRQSRGKMKSINEQVKLGAKVCEEQGWPVHGTYTDGSSASRFGRKSRDDWQKVLDNLRSGAARVLVLWESSRGDRTPETWFAMLTMVRKRGSLIHVISHERTYDVRRAQDWKALARDGVDSAGESEVISERTLRGLAGAAVEGLPHSRTLYGYVRRYDPSTGEFVEQVADPVTGPVAVEVITRVSRGDPIVTIQRDLNERGVPAPRGGRWLRNTIKLLVRNPGYIGKRRHRTEDQDGREKIELHDAVWPPLVKPEVWRAAQRVLDQPDRKKSKPGQVKHLASYWVGTPCGGVLFRLAPNLPRSPRARYACDRDSCVSIGQWELDELLDALAVARLAKPDVRDLFKPDDEDTERARGELAQLEHELAEARESYYKPRGISAEALAGKEQVLIPLIEQAMGRVKSTDAPPGWGELVAAAECGEEAVWPVWRGLPLPTRRLLLKTFLGVQLGKSPRRLTQWSTDDERLALAVERVTYNWREFEG